MADQDSTTTDPSRIAADAQALAGQVDMPQDATPVAPTAVTQTDDGQTVVADASGAPVTGNDGNPIAVSDAGIPTTTTDEGTTVVADPATGEPVLDSSGATVPAADVPTVTDPGSGVEVVAHPDAPTDPVLDNSGSVIPVAVPGTAVSDPVANDTGTPAEDSPPVDPATSTDGSAGATSADPAPAASGDMEKQFDDDVASADSKLLTDLAPEFATLQENMTAPVINLLKEAGNKGIQAMDLYGPEELKKLEDQHQAVFTDVHNKLANFLASLETIFSKG